MELTLILCNGLYEKKNLKKSGGKNIYIYKHTWNQHDAVNQLYSNKNFKKRIPLSLLPTL